VITKAEQKPIRIPGRILRIFRHQIKHHRTEEETGSNRRIRGGIL
jgi:hypothetical protein